MTDQPCHANQDAADSSALQTDSLAKGVLILLTLTVMQRVVGFVRSLLFCRWLDPDQLGQWDLAFGFLMFAAPLAVLGLPGSFGRYVEHYRQQGQLRTFLRRTVLLTAGLLLLASITVAVGHPWFSSLVFGSQQEGGLMLLLAVSLMAVIAFNFLQSLFTALRNYRVVSAMEFANTVIFTTAGVGLMLVWRADSTTVVMAFSAACLVTSIGAALVLTRIWRSLPVASVPVPQRTMWSKLMPFAFWLWTMNWLVNLFEITDRFMIVHYSGLPPTEALDLVGQYHTARLLPLIIVAVTDLLATMITPHLSSDWEAGRRDLVSQRLNMILKLSGLVLVAGSAVVVILAPWLFQTAFGSKFARGLSVLPWALACYIWAGLAVLTCNYFWCAERSRVRAFVLAAAMFGNIGLNLLLLPHFGLLGAVLATALAHLADLLVLWFIAWRDGLEPDYRLLLVATLPLCLAANPWLALVATAALAVGISPRLRCFTAREAAQVMENLHHAWQRVKAWRTGAVSG